MRLLLALISTAALAAPTWTDTADSALEPLIDDSAAPSDSRDTAGSTGAWTTDGAQILTPDGDPLRCRGINWYGFETETRAAHGPWTGRSYEALMDEIVSRGFTCLRVPVGPEAIRPGSAPAGWAVSYGPDGASVLRAFLELAEERGLVVNLSFHSYDPGLLGPELPGRPFGARPDGTVYTDRDWLADLEALAAMTRDLDNVAMIGLCNEPHALSWERWEALAAEGARAVLRGNGRLLVSVAGVGGTAEQAGGYEVNWGANLSDADPSRFGEIADRLVFETHLYPPGAHRLDAHGTDEQEEAWRVQWGHLAEAGAPVLIGEVGGSWVTREDRQWAKDLGDYAGWAGVDNAFAWCLNPHSGWDEGLLVDNDTWSGWHEYKLAALEPILTD